MRLDVKHRSAYSEVTPDLSVTEIAKGSGRGRGIETTIEVPFDKPTIFGRLVLVKESNAHGKANDKLVETNMILVVSAHRVTEKDLGKAAR